MSAVELAPESSQDAVAARLWEATTQEFLGSVSWSDGVLRFPQEHRLLGWRECEVGNCDQRAITAMGLCSMCLKRWRQHGEPELAQFVLVDRVRVREWEPGLCVVAGCARPWRWRSAALCRAHCHARGRLGLSIAQFLDHPDVAGLAGFGPCEVLACTRDRDTSGPYCTGHTTRWLRARTRVGDGEADKLVWRRTESALAFGGEINLKGLADQVTAELLFGLQQRTAEGIKTKPYLFRRVADHLRAQQARTVQRTTLEGLTPEEGRMVRQFAAYARRQCSDPETERRKDVWDAAVFGFSGLLRFTEISQPWLREAAKVLAYNDLPQRRGKGGKQHCQVRINSLALLSQSLRRHRGDDGCDPARLARTDITAFLNRIAFLAGQGQLTENKRVRVVRETGRALAHMRALGLAKPGEPLHGLGEDFVVFDHDIPDEPEDSATGRDLPIEVLRMLCAHLGELEARSGIGIRTAVELLIDTGRRPAEICQLSLDCLERDAHGKPVLIYDNHKANRLGRRLPIPEATAAIIIAQQQRVRERFPDEPAGELKLLPTGPKNPHGRKPVSDTSLTQRHRSWVDSLPQVSVPVTGAAAGDANRAVVVFDKARMVLYAYRHTYAQRHADAGVAPDVLRELMDHRHLVTSQGYYRVGESRRRAAVERVTTMQFDRHGDRIWRQAQTLLDEEHLRLAVGTVAVPYGSCSEPANVAAGGGECPVRFRCAGCAHFSTDVSYLPDLEAYLAGLLRSRERLLVAFPAAEDWARAEAMPSEQEIDRIRRLITRIKADVEELSSSDRAQINEAVALVRRTRGTIVGLGLPRTRQPVPDIRPDRSA